MSISSNLARPRPSAPPSTGPQNLRAPPLNFHKPAAKTHTTLAAGTPYTPEEAKHIQGQLNRVLGPEYVSCRPGGGGQNVSYIEGWKALNLANEIFGFNGWSSELISVQVDYLDSHGGGRVSLGLSVVVRITIKDGTFHEDFGYGNIDNAKNKAMAFEKCKKEAFTDALKRCLRCFGNVLGNCLYDKGIVAKMQKVKLPALELDWDDFHRDPLIVKREKEKQRREAETQRREAAAARNAENQDPPRGPTGPTPASSVSAPAPIIPATSAAAESAREIGPGTGISAHKTAPFQGPVTTATADKASPAANGLTPSLVREYDLDDFDDLFMFSDEIAPADAETTSATTDVEMARGPETAAAGTAPGQVFFTSSKKALDVQKASYQDDIPVYDHRFVANSVKRTVDPNRSTKIRRADLPAAYTPSQINANMASPMAPMATIGKRPLGLPPSQRPSTKRVHREADAQGEKENTNGP